MLVSVGRALDCARAWRSSRERLKMKEVPLGGKMHSSPLSLQRMHGGPPEWMHWMNQHEPQNHSGNKMAFGVDLLFSLTSDMRRKQLISSSRRS